MVSRLEESGGFVSPTPFELPPFLPLILPPVLTEHFSQVRVARLPDYTEHHRDDAVLARLRPAYIFSSCL